MAQPKAPNHEEFVDDDIPEVPSDLAQPSSNGTTLSWEEFGDLPIADSKYDAEETRMTPPAGDWLKNDTWQCTKQIYAGDSQPDDVDKSGRTFLVFYGKPVARVVDGYEHEPFLRFRVSPDIRYKQDKPTEPDMASKLYIRARALYVALNSEKMTQQKQLIAMLTEDTYVVRTMNGDNGPVVLDLKMQRP